MVFDEVRATNAATVEQCISRCKGRIEVSGGKPNEPS
jgi:hypothetical protein